jgi:hypothetical protein
MLSSSNTFQTNAISFDDLIAVRLEETRKY